jgi:hypothetical protein
MYCENGYGVIRLFLSVYTELWQIRHGSVYSLSTQFGQMRCRGFLPPMALHTAKTEDFPHHVILVSLPCRTQPTRTWSRHPQTSEVTLGLLVEDFATSPMGRNLDEIRRDTADAYTTWARWIVVPLLVAYVGVAVFSEHEVAELEGGKFSYAARDTGLKMTTTAPFQSSILKTHLWCGLALVVVTLVQKTTVGWMASSYQDYRDIHGMFGFFVLMLSFTMSGAGFLLGFQADLPNFRIFSVFFAAPWVLWSVSVWFTAAPRRIHLHRLLGNMMLKGCIAVPLSRISGAVLQHAGWGEAEGYYTGIGLASVVVGVWQCADCVSLFLRGRSSYAEEAVAAVSATSSSDGSQRRKDR